MDTNKKDFSELDSLEAPETVIESGSKTAPPEHAGSEPVPSAEPQTAGQSPRSAKLLQRMLSHFNIYLLLFILIVIVAGGIAFVGYQRSNNELATEDLPASPLSPELIEELQENATRVGDPKQTLSIESNTIFSGQVLMRNSLDVAGTIRVGGALNLPGITVSGASSFDQIQANSLSIAGDTNIQGQLTVEENLNIAGNTSFSGTVSAASLNVQSLQLSGDLRVNRHITTGGPTPSHNNGSALGNGGTSSVSGSDTAGTVTLNIGSSPPAGCFITVTFARPFSGTPHVAVTPVGSSGASLNYYVNRSANNFSLCATNAAPSGTSFSFDYLVVN